MHLVFLCNEYPPAPHGGIGSYVQTLGRAYVARGVQVTVFGLYDPRFAGESDDQGVRVIRIGRKGPPGLRIAVNHYRLIAGLRRIHAEIPIDVLEGDEDTSTILGLNPQVPAVLRMHGGHVFFEVAAGRKPRALQVLLERRGFRNANHLVAVSRYVGERTRELLRLGDRSVTVIPNCVDLDLFRPLPQVAEQEGLIVFAGTLVEKKGIRQLLQALPPLVADFPSLRLEVHGGDTVDPETGGSYREKLEAGLPGNLRGVVSFQGRTPREELPRLLARASICCYPSHMEAMPIAWLEGLAMGKAVLASRLGPGPEVIDDGVDGLLINPMDPAEITAGLRRLLESRDLRRRLGEKARQRAVQDYALPHLVDRNLLYYNDLLIGKSGLRKD